MLLTLFTTTYVSKPILYSMPIYLEIFIVVLISYRQIQEAKILFQPKVFRFKKETNCYRHFNTGLSFSQIILHYTICLSTCAMSASLRKF